VTREETEVKREKRHLKRNTYASTERGKWAKNSKRLEAENIPSCYKAANHHHEVTES